jgi:uncharacterized Zn finger protein (UPF0148 family)
MIVGHHRGSPDRPRWARGWLVGGLLAVACTGGCLDASRGHFAAPGFADGEVKAGDPLFVLDQVNRTFALSSDGQKIYRVVAVRGDLVDLGHGQTAHRREVVPLSHLGPGVWLAPGDANCPTWVVATAVTAQGATASCKNGSVTWPLARLGLPTRERLQRKTQDIILSAGVLIVSLGALILGWRKRQEAEASSAAARRALGSGAPPEAPAGAPPSTPREADLLACSSCGAPVPLAGSGQVRCRACGASVGVPEAYGRLLAARRELVDRTTSELAALRRAEIATHPVAALVPAALSVGMGLWLRGVVFRPADGYGPAILNVVVGAMAVGLLLSAIGQLFGYSRLQSTLPALRASRAADGRGFDCRSCGAPLRALEDGAEVCLYCGAQNLIEAKIAQAATAAQARAAASALTLQAAVAQVREAFWVALSYPLSYGGILGVLIGLVLTPLSFLVYP